MSTDETINHPDRLLGAKPTGCVGTALLVCPQCQASTETDGVAGRCPFCQAVMVPHDTAAPQILPEAVLPAAIDRARADELVRAWVTTRRFAPSALKQLGETDSIAGVYLPYWTFAARTESDYAGQSGTHYYVTQTSFATVNGQTQLQSRRVRKTAWAAARGVVRRDFTGVLVPGAARSDLAPLSKVGPWPMDPVVSYQPDHLAGFQALRYDIDPAAAFVQAQGQMRVQLVADCRAAIGGDEQRVTSLETRYAEVGYRHVLLPVWIAGYSHAGRSFQAVVNAANGHIVGDRPYSAAKIIIAIAIGLAALAGVVLALTARS